MYDKEKKQVDVELLSKMVKESGVTIFRIEKDLGIAKNVLLRALQPDTKRPLSPKWEPVLIKYLKKKVAEKKDFDLETIEVKLDLGLDIPEKESSLKKEYKELKRNWVEKLQN